MDIDIFEVTIYDLYELLFGIMTLGNLERSNQGQKKKAPNLIFYIFKVTNFWIKITFRAPWTLFKKTHFFV